MTQKLAAAGHARLLTVCSRIRRADGEEGQGTVEYVGLAMSIGVLLLAVSSFLSGKDHGIGSIITGALKSAIEQASGGAKYPPEPTGAAAPARRRPLVAVHGRVFHLRWEHDANCSTRARRAADRGRGRRIG